MGRERFNRLRIATGEGIEFGLELAGPISRMLAWLIDAVIILSASMVILSAGFWIIALFGLIAPGMALDWGVAALTLALFLVSIGYGIYFEWRWRGQTVGKKILRLRVVDAEGLQLGFPQVLLRNLLRFVDMLPLYYCVGGAVSALTRHSQRLGDLAAGTVVVRLPKPEPSPVLRFEEGKYNTLREHPLIIARLRASVDPAEARLGWRALMRRESLDPEARVEIYRALAGRYRERLRGEGEWIDALPDEALLRGVLEVILERA
ncbi:MAG: RDD family protein [Opitutales bacterium]